MELSYQITNSIKLGINWLKEALFPKRCLCCGNEGDFLCSQHKNFPKAALFSEKLDALDGFFAATVYYDPIVERIIEEFKYQGKSEIAEILAQKIIERAPSDFFTQGVIIPIPLHWQRKLWRGFNQAEKIAQCLAQKTKLKLVHGLIRSKKTGQQAKLKKDKRIENVATAFRFIPQNFPIKKVILVDDVAATGSTLEAAAKTLKNSGVENVYGVVFARGKND